MVLSGRGAEQQSQGHRHRARADQPDARARQGRQARAAATAASPARATARAGASTGRRPISCPATARSRTPADRAAIARVWGVEPEALPGKGKSAYELLDALGPEGGIRALLVFGSNVVGRVAQRVEHRAQAARARPARGVRRVRERDRARPRTWCCRSRSGPKKKAR